LKEVARLAIGELVKQGHGGAILSKTAGAEDRRPRLARTPLRSDQEPRRDAETRDLRMNRGPTGALAAPLDRRDEAHRPAPALGHPGRTVEVRVAPKVGEIDRLGVRAPE